MIRFACLACKVVVQAPLQTAGGTVKCPRCGQRLRVPLPVAPAKQIQTEAPAIPAAQTDPLAFDDERPSPEPRHRRSFWPLVAGCLALVVLGLAGGVGLLAWQALSQSAWYWLPTNGSPQGPLTAEQKALWQKASAPYKGSYVVAKWHAYEEQWLLLGSENGQSTWERKLPRNVAGEPFRMIDLGPERCTDLKGAKKLAKSACDDSKVLAGAVLDLTSKDAPFVVAWYYTDGKAVAESQDAPTPEMARRMIDFLWDLQANAAKY